jgi:hypothetical protein
MASSISDVSHSPAPFSPFSTHSGSSDLATSDESPDLGAFTIVFRALNEFQPRIPHAVTSTVTPTTTALSPMESESDANIRGSTVWNQDPIASYLSITSTTRLSVASRSPPPSEPPSSDTEGEIMIDIDQETDGGDCEDGKKAGGEEPSLGYLDQALQFIAAERAKLTVTRGNSWHRANSSTSDDPSNRQASHSHNLHPQQLTPRRRRRKRKARSIIPAVLVRESSGAAGDDNLNRTPRQERGDPSDLSSPDISSSEAAIRFSSTPGSPVRKAGRRNSVRSASVDGRPRLGHSRSTPALRPGPLDPRVVRLRSLAIKLKFLFAKEADLLTAVLANDSLLSSSPDFIDPRGPAPRPGQPLVHVFIDYSNILIGFLTYLRRHPHHLMSTKVRWMSHAALTLILERGRSVTRRVLVASKPLYQSVEPAAQLDYEVHALARVPDTGDGPDRLPPQRHRTSRGRSGGSGSSWSATKDHVHLSSTRTVLATDSSEPGTSSGSAPSANHPRSTQLSSGSGSRLRYREQAVDELLQLKFLQAVADVDVLPPGSTIVLATGDGSVGQFNEEGFRGCVRTALKKGWRVELYAWEGGLSRAWVREFAEGSWGSRFQIIPIDGFGADLLDS